MGSTISIVTVFKQSGDQHCWPWPVLVSCCLVLGVVPSKPVEGHGYMSEPRSRAMDHLKGDVPGWPIAGAPPRYTRIDCLDLPVNKRFTVAQPGPLKLKFVFPDGANHVGLCQAFLLDPERPAQKVQIGEMMDCARSDHPGPGHKGDPDIPGHMTVTIPSAVPCNPAHCVLQWVWIATHRSIMHPELYNNCADLTITGAQQTTVTAADPIEPPRRADQAPAASLPERTIAPPPALAAGEDAVRQLISYAMADGGVGNVQAIMAVKRNIEALPLKRDIEPGAHQRARAANGRGLNLLHEGNLAEAVQAFQAAYQIAPTDVEIVNNFGYAYLRNHDPEAAEPWLLLALVLSPERVNAWVNLGQAYARQGQHRTAVACLASGYRFSRNKAATRQFLQKLADDEDEDATVRKAAHQTLQLPFVQAAKD
jgi:tetratricopeptide repeat protein